MASITGTSLESTIKTALGDVRNKEKRNELFQKSKIDAAKLRRKNKDKRKRDEEEAKAEGREVHTKSQHWRRIMHDSDRG